MVDHGVLELLALMTAAVAIALAIGRVWSTRRRSPPDRRAGRDDVWFDRRE
jgi:hypothetical protein